MIRITLTNRKTGNVTKFDAPGATEYVKDGKRFNKPRQDEVDGAMARIKAAGVSYA